MKKEHEWIDDDKRYILRADKWNWILISGNSELDDEAYFSNAERWYFTDFIEFSKKLFSIKKKIAVFLRCKFKKTSVFGALFSDRYGDFSYQTQLLSQNRVRGGSLGAR